MQVRKSQPRRAFIPAGMPAASVFPAAKRSKLRPRSGGPHGKGVGRWFRKSSGLARDPITSKESKMPWKDKGRRHSMGAAVAYRRQSKKLLPGTGAGRPRVGIVAQAQG